MHKIIFIVCFCFSLAVSAQHTGVVSGEILDAEMHNEPLLFATVTLKDTENRTRTNFWGRFQLTDILPGDYVLEIAFAGYETLEMPITVQAGTTTEINGQLVAKTIASMDMATVLVPEFENNQEVVSQFVIPKE